MLFKWSLVLGITILVNRSDAVLTSALCVAKGGTLSITTNTCLKLYTDAMTWTAAYADCEARPAAFGVGWGGIRGRLAHVDTAAVLGLTDGWGDAWLGLKEAYPDAPQADHVWVDGPGGSSMKMCLSLMAPKGGIALGDAGQPYLRLRNTGRFEDAENTRSNVKRVCEFIDDSVPASGDVSACSNNVPGTSRAAEPELIILDDSPPSELPSTSAAAAGSAPESRASEEVDVRAALAVSLLDARQPPGDFQDFGFLDDDEIMELDLEEMEATSLTREDPHEFSDMDDLDIMELEIPDEEVKEEKLEGFDAVAGQAWYYPEDSPEFPVRSYQKSMVQGALFSNTLVCLPTGLGKTLIAAVVMYNFYRWYPRGKVVFLCPTRPLVEQQMEAVFRITPIPQEEMINLTGSRAPKLRANDWKERRLFFMTPQTMVSDLKAKVCPAADIRCIVFDEAHRAQGNFAYCEIMRWVEPVNSGFRVLAISATPGADMKKVESVVENLWVSRLDLRTDESLDVSPYVQGKSVTKVVVPFTPELAAVKAMLEEGIRGTLGKLVSFGAIFTDNVDSFHMFSLLQLGHKYHNANKAICGQVKCAFAFVTSMYHLLDLLVRFGMRTLYAAIKAKRTEKKNVYMMMIKDPAYFRLMKTLEKTYADLRNVGLDSTVNFGGALDASQALAPLPSQEGSLTAEDERTAESSHPKFPKLKHILLQHFRECGEDSRVMVFSTFRNSVSEIVDYLRRFRPTLRPVEFKGQSGGPGRRSSASQRRSSSAAKGQGPETKKAKPAPPKEPEPEKPKPKRTTQKRQMETVQQFKDGVYNILVSTSVGEEGLDIGELDLCVCFDAPKSSIRLVQRCGRTGRKREGRIVVLVTEGKEDRNYETSQQTKKRVNWQMGKPRAADESKLPFRPSPRLLPTGLDPTYPTHLRRPAQQPQYSCAPIEPPAERAAFDRKLYTARRKSKEPQPNQDPAVPFKKPPPKKRSGAKSRGSGGAAARLTGECDPKAASSSGVQKLPPPSADFGPEYRLIDQAGPAYETRKATTEKMVGDIGRALESPSQSPGPVISRLRLRLERLRGRRPLCSTLKDAAHPPTFPEPPAHTESEHADAPTPPNPAPLCVGFDFCRSPSPEKLDTQAAPNPSSITLDFDFNEPHSPEREGNGRRFEEAMSVGFDFNKSPSPEISHHPELCVDFDFNAAASPTVSRTQIWPVEPVTGINLGFDFDEHTPSERQGKPITGMEIGFDFNDDAESASETEPPGEPVRCLEMGLDLNDDAGTALSVGASPGRSDVSEDDVVPATPSPPKKARLVPSTDDDDADSYAPDSPVLGT